MHQFSLKLLVPTALVIITVLLNPSARAVGLGQVEVDSRLNEPLRAEIPLLSLGTIAADEVDVRLALPEDFERIGLDRRDVLTHLDFSVETDGPRNVIRVTSDTPVQEPFLSFLLRLDWPQGRLLREYTILLDPPVLAPAAAPEPEPAPERVVEREPAAPAEPARPEPERPAEAPPVATGEYGPVASGETLWRIASDRRPADVSINQMMLALLRTNPDAFFENNINALKRGAVLRIPDGDQIRRLDTAEALEAVRRQNDLWQDYRRGLAEAAPAVVEGAEELARVPDAPDEAEPESRLALVPPREGEEAGEEAVAGPGLPEEEAAEAEAEELRAELARTREELLTERQEAGEMGSRVEELEGQVERLQRLVEMKNEELAALQAGADEPGAAADEPGTPPEDAEPSPGEMIFEDPAEAPAVADAEPVPEPIDDEPVEAAAEEAAAAPAASEPPAPPGRQGWIQWLLSPMVVGILGLLLIGVGIALFLHRRGAMEAETTLQRATAGGAREPAPEERTAEQEAPEEADARPRESGPADYDAAALLAALDNNPRDSETRLKLMRHYAATGRDEDFLEQAETLYAQLADPADPAWQEARRLGLDVAPDDPLFSGGEDIRSAVTPKSGPEEPPAPPSPGEDAESGEREPGGGFPDLEYETPEEPRAPAQEPEQPEESADADEQPGREYSLEDLESGEEAFGTETPAKPEDETRPRESLSEGPGEEAAEEDLDFGDLAETREPESGESATGEHELPDLEFDVDREARSGTEETAPGGDREGPAAGEDAVATKLELAEAYMDMGDEDGARDLLNEVLDEGDGDQKQKAREMLDKL